MMRGMSAARLQELIDFERMASPEWRMDLRFAILAELIAASGGLQIRGRDYQRSNFFQAMDDTLKQFDQFITGEIDPASLPEPTPQQNVKTMIMHLDSWIAGSNQAFRERGVYGRTSH